MKKMLLTYSFLLCFIHIAVCSLAANPIQKAFLSHSVFQARNSSVVKKTFPLPSDTRPDRVTDDLFRQVSSRFVSGISYSFSVEAKSFQLSYSLTDKETSQRVEVERVLKDYLFHIFPSHYFW